MSSTHTPQQPPNQNEPDASTTVSERNPLNKGDSEGADESTVEHKHSTGWSTQPSTSTKASDEEETEEMALQTAQSRFAIALRNGTPFELTSSQFQAVAKALEKSCTMNSPEGTSWTSSERRVRFLALIGDYAGRLFKEIRHAARKQEGCRPFPRTAKDLRQKMEEDLKAAEHLMPEGSLKEKSMSTTEKVRKCIDYLNANSTEVRALDLDNSTVLLAAQLYEERNQEFHCQVRNGKSEAQRISEDHRRKIDNNRGWYLDTEKAGDKLFIERIQRIMAFYPASTKKP